MSSNYEIAKNALSEADKARLVCCFLHVKPTAVNWEAATADFGAASVNSMKTCVSSALKKFKDAYVMADRTGEGNNDGPAKITKRKRNAADTGDSAAAIGDAPKKKPRGKKATPVASKNVEPADSGEEDMQNGNAVKEEEEDA